jgi:hypothetical protein
MGVPGSEDKRWDRRRERKRERLKRVQSFTNGRVVSSEAIVEILEALIDSRQMSPLVRARLAAEWK